MGEGNEDKREVRVEYAGDSWRMESPSSKREEEEDDDGEEEERGGDN